MFYKNCAICFLNNIHNNLFKNIRIDEIKLIEFKKLR